MKSLSEVVAVEDHLIEALLVLHFSWLVVVFSGRSDAARGTLCITPRVERKKGSFILYLGEINPVLQNMHVIEDLW